MLTDLQRDILLKSSESIKEGAWCQGKWFSDPTYGELSLAFAFYEQPVIKLYHPPTEKMQKETVLEILARTQRCAAGEIAWQTRLMGGAMYDYRAAVSAVDKVLLKHCDSCGSQDGNDVLEESDVTTSHNDTCMDGMSKEDAGLHLSGIFREAALD